MHTHTRTKDKTVKTIKNREDYTSVGSVTLNVALADDYIQRDFHAQFVWLGSAKRIGHLLGTLQPMRSLCSI